MHTHKNAFIKLAIDSSALSFGEFKLKSERHSPYFFNAGHFSFGRALAFIAACYKDLIVNAGLSFDGLFGAAYKGIPLVSATALILAQSDATRAYPYTFNRKESKTHGEGGNLIGTPLNGRILIIDDVISAGTALREAISIVQQASCTVAGIVTMLDRQEKGQGEKSAAEELKDLIQAPVLSLINFSDIEKFMETSPNIQQKLREYREQYGVR